MLGAVERRATRASSLPHPSAAQPFLATTLDARSLAALLAYYAIPLYSAAAELFHAPSFGSVHQLLCGAFTVAPPARVPPLRHR